MIRIHSLVLEALVCWAQVWAIFREGTERLWRPPPQPAQHVLCPIAQFIQLHRARQVTQQTNHLREVGVGSSSPEDPNLKLRAQMTRAPQG